VHLSEHPKPLLYNEVEVIPSEGLGDCFSISLLNGLNMIKGLPTRFSYQDHEIREVKYPYFIFAAAYISGLSEQEVKRLHSLPVSDQD
jgi:hypothetical protein